MIGEDRDFISAGFSKHQDSGSMGAVNISWHFLAFVVVSSILKCHLPAFMAPSMSANALINTFVLFVPPLHLSRFQPSFSNAYPGLAAAARGSQLKVNDFSFTANNS